MDTSPLEAEALSLQEFVALLQLEDQNELANGMYLCSYYSSKEGTFLSLILPYLPYYNTLP